MNKAGKILQQVGLAQYANAHLSMPDSSGKIWTYTSRQEAFDPRSSQYGYSADLRRNPKKYDFRPKGEAIYFEGRQSAVPKYNQRKLKGREAHWARRPLTSDSIYSRPSPDEIYHHRQSQKRRGLGKATLGTGIRFLGKGLLIYQLGTYARWIYDDWTTAAPKIIEDLTFAKWLRPLAEAAEERNDLNWSHIIPKLGSAL